jgi:hypothetical protein
MNRLQGAYRLGVASRKRQGELRYVPNADKLGRGHLPTDHDLGTGVIPLHPADRVTQGEA